MHAVPRKSSGKPIRRPVEKRGSGATMSGTGQTDEGPREVAATTSKPRKETLAFTFENGRLGNMMQRSMSKVTGKPQANVYGSWVYLVKA